MQRTSKKNWIQFLKDFISYEKPDYQKVQNITTTQGEKNMKIKNKGFYV
jgi:hypothetical protein